MDKLVKIRIQDPDTGEVGAEVPIGAAAENVMMSDGRTLEQIIGDLRGYFGNKSIAEILKQMQQSIAEILKQMQ